MYPVVEALTALLAVACFAVWGASPEAFFAAGFCSVLVAGLALAFELKRTRRGLPRPV